MPRTCTCTDPRLTHRRAFAFQPRGILLFTYERVCSQCLKAAGALGKHADPAADVMMDLMVPLVRLTYVIRISYRTSCTSSASKTRLQYPIAVLSYKHVAASREETRGETSQMMTPCCGILRCEGTSCLITEKSAEPRDPNSCSAPPVPSPSVRGTPQGSNVAPSQNKAAGTAAERTEPWETRTKLDRPATRIHQYWVHDPGADMMDQ